MSSNVRLEANAVLQFDETRLLQQEKAAPLVDRIIGDRHRSAAGNALKVLMFQRIEPDIAEDADASDAKVVASLLRSVGEERLVLKIIDVDVAGLEREVRRRPIGELDDLDIQTLRLGFGDQSLEGLRIDIWQHADLDGLGAASGAANSQTAETNAPMRNFMPSFFITMSSNFIDKSPGNARQVHPKSRLDRREGGRL